MNSLNSACKLLYFNDLFLVKHDLLALKRHDLLVEEQHHMLAYVQHDMLALTQERRKVHGVAERKIG